MPIIHKTDACSGQSRDQVVVPSAEQFALEVDNLDFAYPDGHVALRGIRLTVERGEKVALVGPNGAGKSTLMLHLNGILRGNGNIRVAGLPLTKDNLPVIRGRVGLVFQNPDDQLFSPTVFEDVAFGPLHMGLPESDVRARVQCALEQVGMESYANRLSHHLSMGEKKRIAIATVLSMGPDLLVLDEPSAGLDPRSRRSLINLLRDLSLTMVVSTHDMLMARELFPRMVIMDEGRVVVDGSTETLLADEPLLEAHGLERPPIC
jgi:cobalt/nickel transport system ATP-binding protein